MALAHSNGQSNKPNVSVNGGGDAAERPTTFHDFLGNKGQASAPQFVGSVRPPSAVAPSATSDLGSERNTSSHLEGIPFYGSRGDTTGTNKRNRSDSLMMHTRDKLQVDSQDSPLLTKLLRYSGGERPRRLNDDETAFGAHPMRPVLSSFMSQNAPRSTQAMPFGFQTTSKRFKDTNVVPSQTAADEGSRTGMKGSGAVLGRHLAGVLIRKQKSGIGISEPDSSPSHHGAQSSSSQMTIFYHGQAHVFDNVHPSKADAIMALARSSGGSWSTSYASDSAARQSSRENNDAVREIHGRPSDKG